MGTRLGGSDLYAGDERISLSKIVTSLPTDGRTIYIRIWCNVGGSWQYSDYTYMAATVLTKGAIANPATGAILGGSSVTFTWTGSGVTDYQLYVGTSLGSASLYAGDEKTNLSKTVTGLPTDGRTLYVRLWSLVGESWQSSDATYTAATQ